jgi:hypothetical protein
VWGVVREGLGESEEGIKDIFPLLFLIVSICFCLILEERAKKSLKESADL